MLTAITPPTTKNLMAPETVLARMGLPESALPDLTLQVEEASALVCRYLGYECAYGTWEETFTLFPTGSGGITPELYLGARPAWSVVSVTQNLQAGGLLAANTYQLIRGPYGESSLYHPTGWYRWTGDGEFSLIGGVGGFTAPDYTARYNAGWWLEEMTGTMPAGVETFPAELRNDFLKVMRWVRASSGGMGLFRDLGVSRTTNEGASMEFFSSKDQAVDPRTGIPESCLAALSFYRRAV